MALFCLRLNRSSCFYPLSAHLTSCFQVYKQGGHAWKTRPFLSSAQLSTKNRFQRATNKAILPLRTAIFARTFLPRDKTAFLQAWRQAKGVAVRTLWGHHIHTSRPLRALPAPLIWLLLKPLQKLLAVILGRSIRKWWVALPPNRRQLAREAAWRSRWVLTAAAAIIMVIAALFLLTHLDESPLTGRTRLLVFSRENYMELAAVMTEDYLEKFAEQLVPGDDPSHRLVERVVQHLADRNKDVPEVSSIPWSVHVVKDPTVNAFVLPNGKVFMFTGMLEMVADIHQLSFVLGHEMAHAILGHSAEQASLSHVVDLLSLILLTAIWALCPRDSLAVFGHWIQGKLIQLMFSRPYSRKLEAEADKVGMQLAAKACADVRAAPVFWQQMEITDQLRAVPAVPEWLSTHPSHRNRVTQMDRFVPQAIKPLHPMLSVRVQCLKETKRNAGYSGALIPDSTDWSLTNNPYRRACYHSHTGDQLRTLGYCVIFGEL
ncbi:metalloendopeptidase OMA1, mitochondrial isoform X2 [Gadus chalcogrammus]|uniref:metalloendopeptidase OMA1, mitochondrial isoform X2 n=1 Tax=Gadus chalcogrammus TaxID=1042646 RepID=UPI0024C4B547|nr:metalloendopeptidase OMA1, mitochondrial isoform X2 [Gadus chalcogrammus]